MKKRKNILYSILIFLIVTVLMFWTCLLFNSYSKETTIYASKMPKTVGATYMTLNNPFFEIIDDEIRDGLEAQGNIMISLDPELDLKTQQEQIEYLIEQNVDALVVNPVDYSGLRNELEKAHEAGIPIFTVDTEVIDEDLVTYNVVSDNYDAGVQCAKDMMKRLDKANIVLLEHNTANSATLRIQGFVDTIKDNDNYQVIKEIECQGQLEIAMPLLEAFLKTEKDVDVVMALNDPSALGALAALEAENKLADVLVYGVDGTPDTKKLISECRMQATVAQSPKTMGNKVAQAINEYFDGKRLVQNQVEPVQIITNENIHEYSLESWQ